MSDLRKFEIHCLSDDISHSEKAATKLHLKLLETLKNIEIKRYSSIGASQSVGDILSITLAAPAIIVLSKGIRDYIQNRTFLKLKIKYGNNLIEVSGDSKNVSKIIIKFLEKPL